MACRLIYGLSGSYLALTGMTGRFQDERVIPGRALMGCQQVSLFTELPRETVRKGYEQQSERGFGRYTERKMDRKATPWRPLRLRWERLRDFSDSLRREILGNPYTGS